jgi:hypothetical protein
MTDALNHLAIALTAAGFEGVETVGTTVFARADNAGAAEFTATAGDVIRLAMSFNVRAHDHDRAAWMRANPKGRLDIVAGETQLTLVAPLRADLAALLDDWRALVHAAAVAAVGWRRGMRPLEGM